MVQGDYDLKCMDYRIRYLAQIINCLECFTRSLTFDVQDFFIAFVTFLIRLAPFNFCH
jgi:hypothetical protein